MAEAPGRPPGRPKANASRQTQANGLPTPAGRPKGFRERLRRDRFVFVLCLAAFAFATWAFALTWWVTGAVVPLWLAVVSVLPALGLFYLRDAA